MRRAAVERGRALRVLSAHRRLRHRDSATCRCPLQPGRFRKTRRVGGCLRPRCGACHPSKRDGRPTWKDHAAAVAHAADLAELSLGVRVRLRHLREPWRGGGKARRDVATRALPGPGTAGSLRGP